MKIPWIQFYDGSTRRMAQGVRPALQRRIMAVLKAADRAEELEELGGWVCECDSCKAVRALREYLEKTGRNPLR